MSLLSIIPLLSLCLLSACGSSEAYYAVQEDPEAPTVPIDGKADAPNGGQFDVSDVSLTFDGDDYESVIVLNSSQAIDDSFGQGATLCRHNVTLGGLTVDWEGQMTTVWARERSGNIKGSWRRAELESEDNGSFKVRISSELNASGFDVYFEDPAALDFVLIQPVEPIK